MKPLLSFLAHFYLNTAWSTCYFWWKGERCSLSILFSFMFESFGSFQITNSLVYSFIFGQKREKRSFNIVSSYTIAWSTCYFYKKVVRLLVIFFTDLSRLLVLSKGYLAVSRKSWLWLLKFDNLHNQLICQLNWLIRS